MNATLVKALEGLPKKLQDHVLARYEKAAAEQRAEAPAYESVLEELYAKRDELLRSRPEFTEAQAFDKVYLDPANRELMMREKEERLATISGRARRARAAAAARRAARSRSRQSPLTTRSSRGWPARFAK